MAGVQRDLRFVERKIGDNLMKYASMPTSALKVKPTSQYLH